MTHPASADHSTLVLTEVRGRVAVLTLNRMHARNAIDSGLSTALGEALAWAAGDPAVRAIVITGQGSVFSSGADLKALSKGLLAQSVHSPEHPEWDLAGVVRQWCDKPLVAAVNGAALGGGLEITLACDLVVASDAAVFGLPEVRWGLFAAAGGAVRLHHLIGMRRALELVLTGTPITATQALEWGLVNQVVPPTDVLDAALSMANLVSSNAPKAVRAAKRAVHQAATDGSVWGEDWRAHTDWAVSSSITAATFPSDEGREGMQAFAEKRDPQWVD